MSDVRRVYDQCFSLIEAIDSQEALLASTNIDTLRKDIWRVELPMTLDGDHFYACYKWEKLVYDSGHMLRKKLESISGAEAILSFADSIRLATFVWRFGAMPISLIKRLAECALTDSRHHLDALPTEELVEVLFILSFCKEHDAVARLAKFAGSRADLNPVLRPLVGDCLYLTSYYRYRPSRERKKPVKHIPPPEEAEKIASRIAGAGTLNAGIYKGITQSLNGLMVESEKTIQEALKIPGTLMANMKSARHVTSASAIQGVIQRAEALEPIGEPAGADFRLNMRHNGQRELVLFVSCDKYYFKSFSDVFLASISVKNPNLIVHFHLVDFELSSDQLEDLEQRFGLRINVSLDRFDRQPGLNAYGDYIVASRFAYLAKVLPTYGAVFLSDIDGVIHRQLAGFRIMKDPAVLLATKVNLETAESKNALWGSMSGGIFGVANTPDCQLFIDAMAHLMLEKISNARNGGPRVFFADQCALAQLYLALRKRIPFRNMEGPFFQQAEDVPGKDRFLNKTEWQAAMLDRVKAGKIVTGFWH